MGQHLQMLDYIYKCETVNTFVTDGTPYLMAATSRWRATFYREASSVKVRIVIVYIIKGKYSSNIPISISWE